MRVVLDTSAYSALMRGHRDVASLVRRAEEVLLPAVVAGELLYGFRVGSRFEENAARLPSGRNDAPTQITPTATAIMASPSEGFMHPSYPCDVGCPPGVDQGLLES